LERLIGYLSQYTLDYLAPTDIRLIQDLPERCAGYKVNSHVRHEMFLSYKEALNNAVKHSGARSISLSIAVEGHILLITLADDGAGFSVADSQGKGEGLLSLRQRLKGVGGECRVQSQPGWGTTINLSLPLEAGDAD
jgi:signal transduction histidine kinase